jgi:hypothetical protein
VSDGERFAKAMRASTWLMGIVAGTCIFVMVMLFVWMFWLALANVIIRTV